MGFFKWLSDRTGEKGLFKLQYNPHKGWHQSVVRFSEDVADGGSENPEDIWISLEEYRKGVETNTMVVLQWYPQTAGGFIYYAATNIDVLAEFVKKEWGDEIPGRH